MSENALPPTRKPLNAKNTMTAWCPNPVSKKNDDVQVTLPRHRIARQEIGPQVARQDQKRSATAKQIQRA